jgi:hypothetical protein
VHLSWAGEVEEELGEVLEAWAEELSQDCPPAVWRLQGQRGRDTDSNRESSLGGFSE